jgi:hypothetical protein
VRISARERFTWVAIGFIFLTCIAILGGLFWMNRSPVYGVLDASWTAPTTNTDGSPLTDLAAYRVYYSPTNPPCPDGPFRTVDAVTARPAPDQRVSVRLTGLTMGQLYYVAVAAVNSRGRQSSCTPTASARARPS